MKIAIIGGKLQGVEAAYLARKAGWEVLLIDKNPAPPAAGLSDIFIQLDINDTNRLAAILKGVKWIFPATENMNTLGVLEQWSRTSPTHLSFDPSAYRISASKLESDRLFAQIGLPVPEPWPRCGFPVLAKPSEGSGSKGVRIFFDQRQLEESFPGSLPPDGWVFQEYLEGPSYSIEIVGSPGNYIALQVTDLEMDAGYDCKRVTAPSELSADLVKKFKEMSLQIAEAIHLRGLMDVEVILHQGQLKILEIDARLPSQTPTVVYRSTGCNILELLTKTRGLNSPESCIDKKGVIYEHIRVIPGALETRGEHIMAGAGTLRLNRDFFGADEALTDYKPGMDKWAATLITTAETRREAWEKREQVIGEIRKHFRLSVCPDPEGTVNLN